METGRSYGGTHARGGAVGLRILAELQFFRPALWWVQLELQLPNEETLYFLCESAQLDDATCAASFLFVESMAMGIEVVRLVHMLLEEVFPATVPHHPRFPHTTVLHSTIPDSIQFSLFATREGLEYY